MKTQLILDAIADKEELGVSDAELTERVITQAQQYGMSPQEFAQQLTAGRQPAGPGRDVRRSKALATVLERATSPTPRAARSTWSTCGCRGPSRRGGDDGAEADAEPTAPRAEAGSATSIRPIGS